MPLNEFVSSLEAAQIIGCGPDAVRLAARSGRLKVALTTGVGRLFRRCDVEVFARERQRQKDALAELRRTAEPTTAA